MVTRPKVALSSRIGAVLLLAILAGCAQIEQDIGQCEAGVEDISTMATIAPSKC